MSSFIHLSKNDLLSTNSVSGAEFITGGTPLEIRNVAHPPKDKHETGQF